MTIPSATLSSPSHTGTSSFSGPLSLAAAASLSSPNIRVINTGDGRSGCPAAFISCTASPGKDLIVQTFTLNVASYVFTTAAIYRDQGITDGTRSDLVIVVDGTETSIIMTSRNQITYSTSWGGYLGAGSHTIMLSNRAGCCCATGVTWGCGTNHGQIVTMLLG
eukprot:TRINITY_DN3516_c0_g1_i1.p1 TRINITY_DN3516_c0_g1~~TRINITY_DN3516_c0_g1_i1.p1  ORF type:complete len:164 (+),score=10.94 TRINITY_DN3516_c0_g1_i1:425-916(+)